MLVFTSLHLTSFIYLLVTLDDFIFFQYTLSVINMHDIQKVVDLTTPAKAEEASFNMAGDQKKAFFA